MSFLTVFGRAIMRRRRWDMDAVTPADSNLRLFYANRSTGPPLIRLG